MIIGRAKLHPGKFVDKAEPKSLATGALMLCTSLLLALLARKMAP